MSSAAVMFVLLLTSLSVGSNIEVGKADYAFIYIRADGSIDPPDAPIFTTDNVTYTLFDNVNGSILIERSGIVVNGNSSMIQGYVLTNIENVTVKNTVVMGGNGVFLNSSSRVLLSGNIIAQNDIGVAVQLSSDNNISGNIVVLNSNYNILMENSSSNTISRNYIGGIETPEGTLSSEYGIEATSSSNNTITQNNVTLCGRAIRFEGYSEMGEDASNNNITENSIQHFEWGLWFSLSSNNTITRNNITFVGRRAGESRGVSLYRSFFSTIEQNEIASHNEGIMLSDSGLNTITQNDIRYNIDGIVLSGSTLNVLTFNNIEGNALAGVRLQHAYEGYVNSVYHNNFIRNGHQAVTQQFPNNNWDIGFPSGGNFWSDYNGTDFCSGVYQNETGSDGIGDAPYVIDENNTDRYPLASPYGFALGDINLDGRTDILDAMVVAAVFGSHSGSPNWNSLADVRRDGKINILDVIIVANNFGKDH